MSHYKLNITIRLVLFCVLFLSACEEAAVPYNNDSTPMKLDTISFPVVQTVTYQVPPKLGNTEYLYFGEKDGYDFLYSLIQFDSVNTTSLFTFQRYNDSLIVADSMRLSMRFSVDSLDENAEFNLRFFPNNKDSIFDESLTYYQNFDKNIASPVIASAKMINDLTDTTNTKVMLNFMMDTSIINEMKDTTRTYFNHTFLVELSSEINSELKFHSLDKFEGDAPKLTVFHRKFLSDSVVSDTVEHDYVAIQDLSLVKPPAILQSDTSNLAVSIGKGLRSLVKVDLGGWKLPAKGIISSANLIFNRSQIDTLTGYSIASYPIKEQADFSSFQSFDKDPFSDDIDFGISSSIVQNKLIMNYRKISTEIGRGKKSNYGFKIFPSANNDPFSTVLFYDLNSVVGYPVMRVIYVRP